MYSRLIQQMYSRLINDTKIITITISATTDVFTTIIITNTITTAATTSDVFETYS